MSAESTTPLLSPAAPSGSSSGGASAAPSTTSAPPPFCGGAPAVGCPGGCTPLATLTGADGAAILHAGGGASFVPHEGPGRGRGARWWWWWCCWTGTRSRWDAPPSELCGVEEAGGRAIRLLAARPVGRANLTARGGTRRRVEGVVVRLVVAGSSSGGGGGAGAGASPPPPSAPHDSFFVSALRACVTAGWGPRPRAVLALINPASGAGRAGRVWADTVAPLLAAAGVAAAARTTAAPGDAAAAAAAADPACLGALVAVGGDGTAAEVLEGLMGRHDWRAAGAALPLSQVPAGSGNALAANAGTPACGVAAALALIRGRTGPLDVGVCVEGEGEGEGEEGGGAGAAGAGAAGPSPAPPPPRAPRRRRTHAFLSLATGLVANADVGTDHLRWMGPARFAWGAAWEALRRRAHPVECWVVAPAAAPPGGGAAAAPPPPPPPPGPPSPLIDALLACGALDVPLPRRAAKGGAAPRPLPPLPPPWTRLPTDPRRGVSFLVACNLPFLDASTCMAPTAHAASGCFEVVSAPGRLPWAAAARLLAGVGSGAHTRGHDRVARVVPAAAVLIRPLCGGRSTCLALDGERVGGRRGGGPAVAVAMECVPGAARLVIAGE